MPTPSPNEVTITVRMISGKNLSIVIPLSASVRDLKLKIEECEGIPPRRQLLVVRGEKLQEDDRSLEEIGISPNSSPIYLMRMLTLSLVPRSISAPYQSSQSLKERTPSTLCQPSQPHTLRLFLRTLPGKEVALEIGSEATVLQLKYLVRDREGIPVEMQRLICAGKQLVDEKALSDYFLESNSTILLGIKQAVVPRRPNPRPVSPPRPRSPPGV